ncbi:MAG: sigma-54-dependent transcriptional regulator [Planctomycetota bacterium]|jgi:two-component system response regulator HydG
MDDDCIILIVDDERDHADGMAESFEKLPVKTVTVYNGKDALDIIQGQRVDVVVTDLKLGGNMDGLGVLEQAKKSDSSIEVILITAYATIETCKEAIKRGAYDYLVKPIDIDQLRTLVQQACKKAAASSPLGYKDRKAEDKDYIFDGVKGKNSVIEKIFDVLRRVSPTNISVLIEGSSGTGKELLARSIHNNSKRSNKPFKPINCAGLTETLLESELFGHVKGSFTGATNDRKGLFEIADKGTLFLDEIGDMPLSMQAKLLRVLEDGVIVPVGSSKTVVVDVRVISATNHDLKKLVDDNKFREDLYFRIKGASISVPSLKHRREDIPAFVDYFIEEAAKGIGSNVKGITDAAKSILINFDWPGNIRQLRNSIETMVVMCDKDTLDINDIPPEIHQVRQLEAGISTHGDLGSVSLDELEKQAIIETLKKTGNNREQAAKILGIGERTLYRKIKEYNL